MKHSRFIEVIDSHTGGEPTRVVVSGAPDCGSGPLAERVERLREKHDDFRRSVVLEPRGSDVLVGALLCEPSEPDCAAGVIFFNNVGYLGMCGHGLIGVMETLAYLGRVGPGLHRIETPVGVVEATLRLGGEVTFRNVPSWRKAKGFTVDVPGLGEVRGDVAWGGNWFYLVKSPEIPLGTDRLGELLEATAKIRLAVNAAGHPEVDHVELFGPPRAGGDSRNFVLCPGGAYDRSPCGTGTSAKLACLAADGELAETEDWRQESIIGSTFRGSYTWLNRERGEILPTIAGRAFVTARSTLIFREDDPFAHGIA